MVAREDNGQERSIVVIGSAALDTKVRTPQAMVAGAKVPGEIQLTVGGVARNIAESLARFEIPTLLIAAVGEDRIGDYLLGVTAQAGVNVEHALRVPQRRTGAFLALLDSAGKRQWSVDDMGVMNAITPEVILARRTVLESARTVVLDNNLTLETLETIIGICEEASVSLCVDPTSTYLAPRLLPFLSRFNLITPNQLEAGILCGELINDVDDAMKAARQLVRRGVNMALITMGDMGVVYATANERGHIAAPRVEVADLTGGSDAMSAAVIYALVQDIRHHTSAHFDAWQRGHTVPVACPAF